MMHYTIRQEKPTQKDIDSLSDFLEWIEAEAQDLNFLSLDEIRDRIKNIPGWRRTVYDCATLVDQCCDAEIDYLEWKPEIKQVLAAEVDHQQWAEIVPDEHPELVNVDPNAIKGKAYQVELYVLAHEGNAHVWWDGEYIYVSVTVPEAYVRQIAIPALKAVLDRAETDYVDVGVYHFSSEEFFEKDEE